MQDLGRLLVILGAITVVAGLVLLYAPRVPWLGRLPGDVVLRRGHLTVYAPFATALVVSVVLTILLNLFFRR